MAAAKLTTKDPMAKAVSPLSSDVETPQANGAAAKKTAPKTAPKKAIKAGTKGSPQKGKASPLAAQAAELAIKAISKYSDNRQKPLGLNKKPFPCIHSGSLHLNTLIGGNTAPDGSGPICPGYPRGHITEIYGQEASGKTTLALEAIAEVQRQGGLAMFLDFEHALHHGYAQNLGVSFDPSQLLLYQPDNMEEGLDMLGIGARAGCDLIVVDSIAAMVPKADMEKKFEDSDQIGSRARKLASALPKVVRIIKQPSKYNPQNPAVIFINQTRANIGGGPHGSAETTSGGKALKFFAYVRLAVTRIKSEFVEKIDPVSKAKRKIQFGNVTQIKVAKSKVDAKQGHTCEIFLRHGHGIDDYYSIIESSIAHKLIKKSGSHYEFDGQSFQGREKLRLFLLDNEATFQKMQDALLRSIRSQAQDLPIDEEDDVDALLTAVGVDEDEDAELIAEVQETLEDAPSAEA